MTGPYFAADRVCYDVYRFFTRIIILYFYQTLMKDQACGKSSGIGGHNTYAKLKDKG